MPKRANLWTPERVRWLRTHRPGRSARDVAQMFQATFGLTVSLASVKNACCKHGIHSGRVSGWTPGHQPWNKGLRGLSLSPATQFKTGEKPHNVRAIGEYRRDTQGDWTLKVRESNRPGGSRHDWERVTHLTWSAHHGPVPRGHVIMILDGDPDNVLDVDNLACVPRAALCIANKAGYPDLPPDRTLRRAALAEATLRAAAFKVAHRAGLSLSERRRLLPSPSATQESTHAR
jgi:hypothetical protein